MAATAIEIQIQIMFELNLCDKVKFVIYFTRVKIKK